MKQRSPLYFAHITDVHISDAAKSWGGLGSEAHLLLAEALEWLNAVDDLDFVLITGDVLDLAVEGEVERLKAALSRSEKPWHFVPGNHDGYIDPGHPEAYQPHEALPLFDTRLADPVPHAQEARWVREVKEGIALVGLDTRKADDWGGLMDHGQMEWLGATLDDHGNDLVIVAMHHPVHHLGPHSRAGWWVNFVCDNGEAIDRLFDQHPQVRMVLAGHHHANHLRLQNGRLHVNTASLSGYPCAYRTIRMEPEGEGWRTQITTHTIADQETLRRAYHLLRESKVAEHYDGRDREAWVRFCEGREEDRTFDGLLGG